MRPNNQNLYAKYRYENFLSLGNSKFLNKECQTLASKLMANQVRLIFLQTSVEKEITISIKITMKIGKEIYLKNTRTSKLSHPIITQHQPLLK
jgi:hypothetical protein